MISIWFFIGCLLSLYGALILFAGLRDFANAGATDVVLHDLHLQIWWGVGLLALGGFYAIHYRPRRQR